MPAPVDAAKQPMHVHCGDCSHEWVCAYLPLPATKLVPLMKARCPSCGSKRVNMGLLPRESSSVEAWVGNGDTGTSSLTIWAVLMGRTSPHGRYDIPYDPADFGRCYRLLKIAPEWRARLQEVADVVPAWKPFVRAWDLLTETYEHELSHGPMRKGARMAPRTYEMLQRLRPGASDAD